MKNLEWLETNGTGSFICGAVSGMVERKWHGWWQATRPPRARRRLLAGIDETISTGDRHWKADDAKFVHDGFPRWKWDLGNGVLTKTLFVPNGIDAVIIQYALESPDGSADLRMVVEPIEPDGDDAEIRVHCSASFSLHELEGEPEEAFLPRDKECEDVYTEMHIRRRRYSLDLKTGESVYLVFLAPGIRLPFPAAEHLERERLRREKLSRPAVATGSKELSEKLALAADQFLVRAADGRPTIMAGYPWFTDWGRDTMISIRGLCIATGRLDEARDIIRHFLDFLDGGVIPNLFPETGEEPEYNTVDATLWLVEAAFRAWTAQEIAQDEWLWGKLREIIEAYRDGTVNNIGMDDDGLIHAGTAGTQLTWMDIKIEGHVPTPRHGKPVEIQALWYNALRLMEGVSGDSVFRDECRTIGDRVYTSFCQRFMAPDCRIADVVDRDGPGTADWLHRANEVIPFALSHNIIPKEWRPVVLRRAAYKLLTPSGLRSLSPDHPDYKPVYTGNRHQRDRAYHQGTAWFWLAMPYFKGVYEERDAVPELYTKAPEYLKELERHFLSEGCVNQVGEVADGDPPHHPKGCFAQAWSTAAMIEIMSLPFPE